MDGTLMKRLSISILLSILSASPAIAQTAAPPLSGPTMTSPTDLELEQARSAMLGSQVQYFVVYIRKIEAQSQKRESEAAILAEWWKAYVGGLSASVIGTK
jgi:hypothetical protein